MEIINFTNKENELILSLEIDWENRMINCIYEKDIHIEE